MKITVPRNREIPDMTFADVLRSGALARDDAGRPEGDSVSAYRGNKPRLPKADFISAGKLYAFKFGLIFIPEQGPAMGDHLAETLNATATLLVGSLPKLVLDAILQQPDAGARPSHASTTGQTTGSEAEVVDKLTKLGARALPGVEIVELYHQIDAGGFFRQGSHHSVLSYERLDGQRSTYTFASFAPSGARLADLTLQAVLRSRVLGELDYLSGVVKESHVNSESVWLSHVEQYQKRYGGDWVKHIEELSADVTKVLDGELERQGFTTEKALGEILERIAPLVPYYRQAPQLRDWVAGLEEASRGKTTSALT